MRAHYQSTSGIDHLRKSRNHISKSIQIRTDIRRRECKFVFLALLYASSCCGTQKGIHAVRTLIVVIIQNVLHLMYSLWKLNRNCKSLTYTVWGERRSFWFGWDVCLLTDTTGFIWWVQRWRMERPSTCNTACSRYLWQGRPRNYRFKCWCHCHFSHLQNNLSCCWNLKSSVRCCW